MQFTPISFESSRLLSTNPQRFLPHPFCRFDSEAKEISYQQSLRSLLITPVQRVPRYVLLLQEVCKLTPSYHKDYVALKSAYEKINAMAGLMNSKKAEQAHLLQIQQEITTVSSQVSHSSHFLSLISGRSSAQIGDIFTMGLSNFWMSEENYKPLNFIC